MKMRKRNNNAPSGSPGGSDDESNDEESIVVVHPQEIRALHDAKPSDGIPRLDSHDCRAVLERLREGKAWWAQCLTIYVAAALTYSYHNVGAGSNIQIAIMTVIALFGATPFASTHLIPASIGAFVGGHNIIGSTGPIEDVHVVSAEYYFWLLLLSSAVGIVWCFVINDPRRKTLDGCAGRLGTTTFVGMNLVMVTIYGPAGVVDWDRYYYGFVHIIHVGEEDSSSSLATAWQWTEEAEAAIGYVLSVLWLGAVAGGTRVLHDKHRRRIEARIEEAGHSAEERLPPPLNNVLVPVLWALLSMLAVNATKYEHAPGLYNGFAVGAYVAMASLQKIPTVSKFASASLLAAGWGLALTPFFVGFAGKSGFTSMLGHVTQIALGNLLRRFRTMRRRRRDELRRQLEQLQLEMQEQRQALQSSSKDDKGEAPPSPPHKHHKPKKDTFYTKQQRRQQQRLKHLREEGHSQESPAAEEPPKLHHRAWSALPVEGDGVWQHSLEPQQDSNDLV